MQRRSDLSPGSHRRFGFTALEVVVALVILAIVAIILFPIFIQGRSGGGHYSCMGNMRLIGLALTQYEQDDNERLPPMRSIGSYAVDTNDTADTSAENQSGAPETGQVISWRADIFPYVRRHGAFRCPTNAVASVPDLEHDGLTRSYGVNSTLGGLNDIGGPFSGNHPELSLKRIKSRQR